MKWSDIMSEDIMQKGDALYAKANALRQEGEFIYPPQNKIYRALKLTPPDKVKVCIIGQDPYYTPGDADGLAFSSACQNRRMRPSVENILTELQQDLGCKIPKTADLTPWAERGVLLLNTVLTVKDSCPGSHADWGWQDFTGHVFDLCAELPQPIVFILWGGYARKFASRVCWSDHPDKLVLQSAHPSPLSANRGFFGSRPFSKANRFLQEHGVTPVDWNLT